MSLRSAADCSAFPADRARIAAWFTGEPDSSDPDLLASPHAALATPCPAPDIEAERVRRLIETTIGDVFGVPQADLSRQSRGKAPVALARQAAMYLAHVACGLNLTDVGRIFARDRTTVAHACAVIEDRRDDPVFDRALELMEWIVPTLIGRDALHARHDT